MGDRFVDIADLERANYAATMSSAQATPDIELTIHEDVILTSSPALPIPDANHACLLRATPDTIETLIDRIIAHFESLDLPTTVYVSPACSPEDIPQRLVARGFSQQEYHEAWMVLGDLQNQSLPPLRRGVQIRRALPEQALIVAEVFLTSFEMPVEFAPVMASLLSPSLGLEDVHYYLAYAGDQPIGTCSWHRSGPIAVLGSAGVLPARRGGAAALNLGVTAITDARDVGIETMILQTIAGTTLERLLRIYGFTRAFERTGYTR